MEITAIIAVGNNCSYIDPGKKTALRAMVNNSTNSHGK